MILNVVVLMTSRTIPKIVLLLLFLCRFVSADAADWSLYRGDEAASGRVAGDIPFIGKPQVLWEQRLEKEIYETSPIVAVNTIFIGSYEGMAAFDLQTGKPKWQQTKMSRQDVAENDLLEIAAPAAYFDNKVYVGDVQGFLHAFTADAGKLLWSFDTGGAIDNSPNIDVLKERVLIGSQCGILFALDTKTGKPAWKYQAEDQIRCFPSIIGRHGFVAGCDSHLHVVNLDTGKGINQIPLDAPTGSTPLIAGDVVFVGTEGSEFLAINWKRGKVLWRYSLKQAIRSPAAHKDETIVFGGMDKTVYALNAKTGKERWKYVTKGRIEGGTLIAGNQVYVPSTDSSLYVLDLQTGKLINSIELTGKLTASPAFIDGRMIIASDEGVLTCLQIP